MAQQNINEQAENGTEQEQSNQNYTPRWDEYSREMYPFLNIKEEQKRAGFSVKFLSDKPRKETQNNFDHTSDVSAWSIYTTEKRENPQG